MNEIKKILLLTLTCFVVTFCYAQNTNWILGTWYGTGTNDNKVQFIKTLIIDSVNGTNFAGTRTNELQDRSRAKIVTSFSGYINNDRIYITNGNVIYKKEPPKGQWTDCSGCLPETKVTINPDKIILTSSITGCQKECNSISIYYRPMSDFDTSTQRYLIKRFGTASDIKNFKPCKSEVLITEEKKSQQHIDESLKTAAITVLQREQQRIKDSITNAEAAPKKRQKDIDD